MSGPMVEESRSYALARHPEITANIARRRRKGQIWHAAFYAATAIAIVALVILLISIFNRAFGLTYVVNEREPEAVYTEGNLEEASPAELIALLEEYVSTGIVRRFNFEEPLVERSQADLYDLVLERVINPTILEAWTLGETVFQRGKIEEKAAEIRASEEVDGHGELQFRSWITPEFLVTPQNPVPEDAGIRTAFLGSLWMIVIVILFAFPVGVAAAIYLEEYAKDNWFNRFIKVNVYNLSGVPSIIYGLLGLVFFVRALEPFTSGAMFGTDAGNGRTIISAGLTLSLLILPIIIIASQEAIRAVSNSIRESSYGIGATKWQTIWHHILPQSFDRILTGTILAISRAVGETAPLVVVGASTFISVDPSGFFAKFTTLPIQIYQWSARPQGEFRNVAAGAIIVLLILTVAMNASAIIMRNRIAKKRSE